MVSQLALRADGTVIAWGKGWFGSDEHSMSLANVASIGIGEDYSLALIGLGSRSFITCRLRWLLTPPAGRYSLPA